MSGTALQLAQMLIEHVRGSGVVDLDLLSSRPAEALKHDSSVTVAWVDPETLPRHCSIAATYDSSSVPARICVPKERVLGRQRFSLLHEYGHHLRDQVPHVLEILFQAGPRAGQLEESMCDAFASQVLVPDTVRTSTFADGVAARSIAKLMAASSASEWAVAVAAAESLEHPGYVMLLNRQAESVFAARAKDVFPVRRGTVQTGLLARAAQGLELRGTDRIDLGPGSSTVEMNIETAVVRTGVVAVAVDGPVSWRRMYAGRASWAAIEERVCEHCNHTHHALGAACPTCGVTRCPECGRCECGGRPMRGERACAACFVLKPPGDFESDAADRCVECS